MRPRFAISILFLAVAGYFLSGNLDTVKAQVDCGYQPYSNQSWAIGHAPGIVYTGQCYQGYQLYYSCCSDSARQYVGSVGYPGSGYIQCVYQYPSGYYYYANAYPCCNIYY